MIFQPPQNFHIPMTRLIDRSYSKTGRLSEAYSSRQKMFKTLDKPKLYIHKNLEPKSIFQKQGKNRYKRSLSHVLNNSNQKSFSPRLNIKTSRQNQLHNNKTYIDLQNSNQTTASKLINLLKIQIKSRQIKDKQKKQVFRYKTIRQLIHAKTQRSTSKRLDRITKAKDQQNREDLASTNISYLSIQNLRKSRNQSYIRVSRQLQNIPSNKSINICSNLLSTSKKNQILKTTENQQEDDQTSINICISQKSFKNSQDGQFQQEKARMQFLSKELKASNAKRNKNSEKEKSKKVIKRKIIKIDKQRFGNVSLLNNPSMTIKSLRQNFICQDR